MIRSVLALGLLVSMPALAAVYPGYEFRQGWMNEEVSSCPAGECVTTLSQSTFSDAQKGVETGLGAEVVVGVKSHQCDYPSDCTLKTLAGMTLYTEPKLLQTEAQSGEVQTLVIFNQNPGAQKSLMTCETLGWDPQYLSVNRGDFSKGVRLHCYAYGSGNRVMFLSLDFAKTK